MAGLKKSTVEIGGTSLVGFNKPATIHVRRSCGDGGLALYFTTAVGRTLWRLLCGHDSGTVELQEQKIWDIEELVELCTRTEESCPGFTKFDFLQIALQIISRRKETLGGVDLLQLQGSVAEWTHDCHQKA